MYTPDVIQTIKKKKLTLTASLFMRYLLVSLQAGIIGITFLLASLLLTEVLQTYFDKQLVFVCLLLVSYVASYLLAQNQYCATVLPIISQRQFQEDTAVALKEFGFIVFNNNKRFLFATCIRNRANISDNFYAVYTKSSVLIFCLCELPFPFSTIKSKSVIATIKARCKSG